MASSRELRVERFEGVEPFLDRTERFLVEREAEHNLILGIATNLRLEPEFLAGPPNLFAVSAGGRVVAAAVHTPPYNLVLSEIDDPGAISKLVDELPGELTGALPGVNGPVEHAAAFAAAWSERTGRGHRLQMAERIFRLDRVIAPAAVSGRLRPAEAADRDRLIGWLAAFAAEALDEHDESAAPRAVDRWLARRGRTLHLWDDGRPVSLAGTGGLTPNGIRIGPVYTPPELRNRGYASACVAAASQAQLDAGRTFCFLFTDQANPTSNHIYRAIGYRPVRDVQQFRFERSPGS